MVLGEIATMHSSRILLLAFLLAPIGCDKDEDPSVRSDCSTDNDCFSDEICRGFDNPYYGKYQRCVCRPGSLWCECEGSNPSVCDEGLSCDFTSNAIAAREHPLCRAPMSQYGEEPLPPIQCDSDTYCRPDEQCVFISYSDAYECRCRPGAAFCDCAGEEQTCEDGLSCLDDPEENGEGVVCR